VNGGGRAGAALGAGLIVQPAWAGSGTFDVPGVKQWTKAAEGLPWYIQNPDTMKKITTKKTYLLAVLALGLTASASAQTMQGSSGAPPAVDPGPGLVGTNYTELSYGYQHEESSPGALHDWRFVSNGAGYNQGIWGLDGNFTYDYLYGHGDGYSDHRNEALFGVTNYLLESWGKPFVTTDLGYAWERAAGVARKSFAYTFTGGVEFRVMQDLAISPYLSYEGEPHLYNHGLPAADFPNYLWEYGVKATYRLTRHWNASLGLDLDSQSGSDVGGRASVSYRF
jgi:hypothetical protein